MRLSWHRCLYQFITSLVSRGRLVLRCPIRECAGGRFRHCPHNAHSVYRWLDLEHFESTAYPLRTERPTGGPDDAPTTAGYRMQRDYSFNYPAGSEVVRYQARHIQFYEQLLVNNSNCGLAFNHNLHELGTGYIQSTRAPVAGQPGPPPHWHPDHHHNPFGGGMSEPRLRIVRPHRIPVVSKSTC